MARARYAQGHPNHSHRTSRLWQHISNKTVGCNTEGGDSHVQQESEVLESWRDERQGESLSAHIVDLCTSASCRAVRPSALGSPPALRFHLKQRLAALSRGDLWPCPCNPLCDSHVNSTCAVPTANPQGAGRPLKTAAVPAVLRVDSVSGLKSAGGLMVASSS